MCSNGCVHLAASYGRKTKGRSVSGEAERRGRESEDGLPNYSESVVPAGGPIQSLTVCPQACWRGFHS